MAQPDPPRDARGATDPAGGGVREGLRRELRGLTVLYVVFLAFAVLAGATCVGSGPPPIASSR